MREPWNADAIAGLRHNGRGTVGLSGALLELHDALESAFLAIAREFSAEPHSFTPILAADDLRQIDYFSSFPQLVTMPVAVERSAAELEAFRRANGAASTGPLVLGRLAPLDVVLAPAACYAVYPSLRGALPVPRTVTVSGTCFRHEEHYEPLRRQHSFRMREIVHLGDAESAQRFLAAAREQVGALARRLDLPVEVQAATDPFFDPSRSPKYLHQKLFPTKHELVFDGELAIGSFNYHRAFFGEAFGLRGPAGGPAHTACVAFGVERWLYAILRRHGAAPSGWPLAGLTSFTRRLADSP